MSFNAQQIDLQGRHLIEASAGTGKTYSIANVFLRFLLEARLDNSEPLLVNQILVVTFTNAAAEELRARIRLKIEAALAYLKTGESKDDFIKEYLSKYRQEHYQQSCIRLYQAVLCIDEAAIYTIHSFAVRALKMFMFETGAYADVQVNIGKDQDKDRLIKDLWREMQLLDSDASIVFTKYKTFYSFLSKSHQAEIIPRLTANSFSDLYAENEAVKHNMEADSYVKAFVYSLFKNRLSQLEKTVLQPEDAIALLNAKLMQASSGEMLRDALIKQFPVCLVDECQDTDPDQFRLFNTIYQGQNDTAVYFIGDPKQSIYAFRGADIYSYLTVKKSLKQKDIHTLDTNYRSTDDVMSAVNALFKEREGSPSFMYEGIDYQPIKACDRLSHGHSQLWIGDQQAKPFVFVGSDHFDLFSNLIVDFANDAAERIVQLLNQQSYIETNEEKVKLRAADITVLVRDKTEAFHMKAALKKRQLASVYLSQKDSVFLKCDFAQDILFLLKAIAEPTNKQALKAAYSTLLLRGFSTEFTELDRLENDDDSVEQRMSQFAQYNKVIQFKGILAVLYQIVNDENLHLAFAAHENKNRFMTDFRHLGELLQKEFSRCKSLERLIEWYQDQLNDDDDVDTEEKSQRLESDAELIQIVTLHGCKGLEYKVVFIPFFFSGLKELKDELPLLHSPSANGEFKAQINFSLPKEDVDAELIYKIRAENLRLLYVGITRAIYQCYIGVANARIGSSKKSKFATSVWAYLLDLQSDDQIKDDSMFEDIGNALALKMAGVNYSYESTLLTMTQATFREAQQVSESETCVLPKAILPNSHWLITSYSSLAAQKEHVLIKSTSDDESLEILDNPSTVVVEDDWQDHIRFTLERSNRTGDCLHSIFEAIAKDNGVYDRAMLEHYLRLNGLLADMQDQEIHNRVSALADYIQELLQFPLLDDAVPCLNDIFKQGSLPEMVFDFSIAPTLDGVSIHHVNTVLRNQCGIASGLARRDAKPYIKGMMNGSMDLLFVHDKKVYVVDYKSNTLGTHPSAYNVNAMHESMQSSRYDLQYFIYSVAAHRYMKQRLGARYEYNSGEYQFGGVLYLYVRGMACKGFKNNGIYFTRPNFEQVNALDLAFSGITQEVVV